VEETLVQGTPRYGRELPDELQADLDLWVHTASGPLVFWQDSDADLPKCVADDEGEDDRSLTTSDTTRSLNQAQSVRSSLGKYT